ncbi:MAG TPA: hypothetical protein VHN74_06905 [Candidatus Angelobacter sp.]|jgi:hypothetical protein|nr:hypothetical protein [Candidatus Angelobacter sp.]
MTIQNITRKLLAAMLALAICLTPEMFAQSTSTQTQQKPSPAVPQNQPQNQNDTSAPPQQQTPATQNQSSQNQSSQNQADQQQGTSPDAEATGAQQPSATQGQQAPAQPAPSGTSVNPSQGPLQPVTTYPDAAGNAQSQPQQTDQNTPEAPQPKQQQQSAPVGAATAERVPTAGGAVAKPAGAAIAPAKQHQTRSLLIKMGAVAAAGAAVGTIFALSRGTSSKPPGAPTTAAPQIIVFRH